MFSEHFVLKVGYGFGDRSHTPASKIFGVPNPGVLPQTRPADPTGRTALTVLRVPDKYSQIPIQRGNFIHITHLYHGSPIRAGYGASAVSSYLTNVCCVQWLCSISLSLCDWPRYTSIRQLISVRVVFHHRNDLAKKGAYLHCDRVCISYRYTH